MRVVIDTNIFVSSFFGGKPRKVIDLWKNGFIILCLSKEIVDEYLEVLQRMGLQDRTGLAKLLALFARGFNCVFTSKTPELKIVENDPDDDKFIECAVALHAKYIITGDKEVLNVRNYMDIHMVSPDHFLDLFEINREDFDSFR